MRRTLVIASRFASGQARFHAATEQLFGLQILTVPRLASRLAGGFVGPVDRETLQDLVKEALRRGGFKSIGELADLPGMVRAVTATLSKAWNSDLDLKARADEHPRISDLALIQSRIREGLPAAMRLPPELAKEALANISHAPAVLGPITVQGVCDLPGRWRPLIRELAKVVPVEWYALADDEVSWLDGSGVKVIRQEASDAKPEAVVCANPRHEALEALRWARKLIASGEAVPGEIGITAASVEPWDDHIRVIADESDLPMHFAHGRSALSASSGQQAAALADVLLRGLSRSRVLRLVSLCRHSAASLMSLPDNWKQAIRTDSPLMSLQQWEYVWEEAASRGWPNDVDQAKILRPVLEKLVKGKEAAPDAGESLLQGQALALWQQALREGPAAALETTLSALRIDDDHEPAVSIFWGPAHVLVSSPRRHVRLLGLNSRNWPRRGAEDPLLPDYIIPSKQLEPLSGPARDRLNFSRLVKTASSSLVFSRCRRDSEGRLLGRSPLPSRNLEETHIQILEYRSTRYHQGRDPQWNLRENGATKEEIEFLLHERVELNAFTSEDFVTWLEEKLDDQGVEKVIPDDALLNKVYRRIKSLELWQKIFEEHRKDGEARIKKPKVPKNLRKRVVQHLDKYDDVPWDIALTELELKEPKTRKRRHKRL